MEFLNGRVLKVFTFSSQHPEGELPILTFAVKGASVEFGMIQLRDVIERCVSDAIIGVVGSGKAKSVMRPRSLLLSFDSSQGGAGACLEVWEGWRTEACDDELGVLLVELRSYVSACCYSSFNIISGICATIFS